MDLQKCLILLILHSKKPFTVPEMYRNRIIPSYGITIVFGSKFDFVFAFGMPRVFGRRSPNDKTWPPEVSSFLIQTKRMKTSTQQKVAGSSYFSHSVVSSDSEEEEVEEPAHKKRKVEYVKYFPFGINEQGLLMTMMIFSLRWWLRLPLERKQVFLPHLHPSPAAPQPKIVPTKDIAPKPAVPTRVTPTPTPGKEVKETPPLSDLEKELFGFGELKKPDPDPEPELETLNFAGETIKYEA